MSLQLAELNNLYTTYTQDAKFNSLRGQGIKFVQGKGPLNPTLMLIGEAPGRMENAHGEPFRGKAGIILSNLLIDSGLDPGFVFMTNVVKYWPRDPNPAKFQSNAVRTITDSEMLASREYLKKEIEIVNPLVIGLLGRSTIQAIYPSKTDVYTDHGKLLDGKFVPLYHPAVVSYDHSKKPLLREGFKMLSDHIYRGLDKAS